MDIIAAPYGTKLSALDPLPQKKMHYIHHKMFQ